MSAELSTRGGYRAWRSKGSSFKKQLKSKAIMSIRRPALECLGLDLRSLLRPRELGSSSSHVGMDPSVLSVGFCPNAEAGESVCWAGAGAGAVSMSLSQFLRSPCDAMLRSKAGANNGAPMCGPPIDRSCARYIIAHSCRVVASRMQSVRIDAIFLKELYLAHHLAFSGVFAPSSLFRSRPSFSHVQSIACDP